ncbi:hypothetical protein [Sutcliffiella horikoshii]|uniref:hypothetical protein n=1 Tax=Sutcliffiella horikoshii TaxID=79883 RepID=UPI00384E5FBA
MKKKLTMFLCSALLVTTFFVNPLGADAHHGGSNWSTHNIYYSCIGGNWYKVEQQHRNLSDGSWDYRNLNTYIGSSWPIQ